ncbi:serine/threonine-protein kinase [Paraliomyxa miuraensis]|uniref:serine/threonine-protein kinase n=1 Tax=Paraliomyxa miuraensis TaxID=376150 RepID=UPI0022565256|nr:serine/threonine-protein kinase [Paraliomyxa miuraensis]MCX4241169.1 serine/threonine-protein kinase [Paraliomyxa miuraensis]
MEREPSTDDEETKFQGPADPPSVGSEDVPFPAGVVLGRYQIHGVLGRGGMGLVHAAHDPVLDRKVALKVLRGHDGSSRLDDARDRMRREAQALAHLSHPNVVTIFDVTVVEGQLVLAMELIEGPTLREWLDDRPRPWPEILAMFAQAGAGLAAAHAADIVHRDFKPSNVLIDPLGRPRVADFGLARFGTIAPSTKLVQSSAERSISIVDERMTATGTVLGTPLYMAPEQRMGEAVDQRCDLFAFCVALYMALYDQRPFEGPTDVELLRAQIHDELVAPPRSSRIPRAVFAVLRRGLASKPGERYETMDALLRALSRAAGQTRRRTTATLAAGGVLALGALLFASAPAAEPPCPRDPSVLGAAWDAERRASVAAAFASSTEPYAAAAWSRLEPRLDAQVDAWLDTRQEACRTGLGLTSRPSADGDRMMACLERRRQELDALTEVLATARPEVVQHAVAAVSELVPAEGCTTVAEGGALVPEDPELVQQVLAFQSSMAGVEAELAAGSYAQALVEAERLAERAQALGHEPTLADALFVLGTLQGRVGRHDQGVATLESAAHLASSVGHDRLSARVAIELVYLLGQQLKRYEDALEWVRHAEAATQRIGDPPEMLGRLLGARGNVQEGLGHYPEAEQDYQQSLELLRQVDPESAQVARAINNLGNVRFRDGRISEAGEAFEQAHRAWARALGPEHPDVVMPLNNLASVRLMLDDREEGKRLLEQVLANWERSLGPDHFRLALPHHNLAVLARNVADYDTAIDHDRRAMEIRRKAFGSDHIEVAQSLSAIGKSMRYLGRCAEAVSYFREAVEIQERLLGPEHVSLAPVLNDYARCQVELPDQQAALPLVERSLAIHTAVYGTDSSEVRTSLYPMGLVQRTLGRTEEAIETLEHALRLSAGEGEQIDDGHIRFELAKALAQGGREEALVLATARQAREDYLAAGDEERANEVEAWLARAR